MSFRSLLPVAVAAVLIVYPAGLRAQAVNSDCRTSDNPLNCTGPSSASAGEFLLPQPESPPDARLMAASLGAILAQRLADKPAAQQAWSRATSDNARLSAQSARGNYNAMTGAIQRLMADSAASTEPRLNGDLNLDFSVLRDVEARYEDVNPGTGRRKEALTRMSFAPSPSGEEMFRLDESGGIFVNQQKAWTYRSSIQYAPASSIFYQTEETIPLVADAPPGYEAAALVGDHAFAAPMPPRRRVDTKVPPGVVYPTMLGLVISAMKGELPASFRIWILSEQGEVVPADISVVRELTVQEPVGPAGGTCDGAVGTEQPRRAVELQVSAGALSHTRVVLADAPHLKVSDGLKCRVVR